MSSKRRIADPTSEMGTREWFAANLGKLGFSIVKSSSGFPDYELVNDKGSRILAEAEHKSSSFLAHGHDPHGCDLVVCWEHDAALPLPVVELATGKQYKPNERGQSFDVDKDARRQAMLDERNAKARTILMEHLELSFQLIKAYEMFLKKQSEWSVKMGKVADAVTHLSREVLFTLKEGEVDVTEMSMQELIHFVIDSIRESKDT